MCLSYVCNPTTLFSIVRIVGWLVDAAVNITNSPALAEELRHEFLAVLVGASRGEAHPVNSPPVNNAEVYYDVVEAPPRPPPFAPPRRNRTTPPADTNQCEAFTEKGGVRCAFVKQRDLRVCAVHLHYWRRRRRLPAGGVSRPYVPDSPARPRCRH